MRLVKALLMSAVVASLAAGCSDKGGGGHEAKPAVPPLSIGLIPEQNIFRQLDRYQPFADYVTEKSSVPIHLRILPRYGNIIRNFEDGRMDGAFFGSFTYVLAHHKLEVDVLARPEQADGASTYHGLIIVRKDSGIRGPADMKGKVLAFVDKATTAGYLYPLAYFQAAGIGDPKRYFREVYFAGTHENVVADVLARKADVGTLKNTIFERMVREDSRLAERIVILSRSKTVPENGLAVRRDLDPAVRQKLKELLLGMHGDPKGREALTSIGAARFIETTEQDYAAVLEYADKVGIDLATYDYEND